MVELGVWKGGSLRMWRDFFSNAQIHGIDVVPEQMFSEERIKTYWHIPQYPQDLRKILERIGPEVDLFIDDGDHHPDSQINTCLAVMPLLGKNALYVIEDVGHTEIVERLGEYKAEVVGFSRAKYRDDHLVVVRHNG